MKRLLVLLLALAFALLPVSAPAETVVTSFYPIYLFTLNLTRGLDGVTVRNLAAPGTGCLHDYQLQTGDMKALSDADAFLVNGAGMEAFLDRVFQAFPKLPVITATDGIQLTPDTGAEEIGEKEAAPNAHVWLDAKNASRMVQNLSDGLQRVLPQHKDRIAANRDEYISRLDRLDTELREGLKDLPHKDIITFHDAFPYFAKAYGLNVAAVVHREPGETLSPTQLAKLADTVRRLGVPPLFTEPQYEDLAARTLSAETGAKVYRLDPVVTGPDRDIPADYYETVMRRNMDTLKEALS